MFEEYGTALKPKCSKIAEYSIKITSPIFTRFYILKAPLRPTLQETVMKSTLLLLLGFFAAGAVSAPLPNKAASDADAFNYHNNIDNLATIHEASADSDEFNYHNNIDNLATIHEASAESDEFNYTNNIDNAVTVVDSDGTLLLYGEEKVIC